MMKILIADDFELLREDRCDTLGAQADMEVVGAAQSGAQVEEMAIAPPIWKAWFDVPSSDG